ncbi:MAG TPA: sigma-70 family RNA polymerase sigma factor [Polyangia bacterium]|nr:sigma-70 family RNA polymerase sigma factor [Polyangia bacterium]
MATSGNEGAGAAIAAAPPLPSFEQVYEAYFAFVWRNVLNRGVPASAVDDVVQEVFMVVHRKLPGFEGRSSMRTWLAGVVRRVVMDHVRKRGNAPAGDEPLAAESISPARGPGEELDAKVAVRALDELLSSMPESQREVFILHEIEEMTGREIADAVGANENTVHTRLRAARRLFKKGLARLRGE